MAKMLLLKNVENFLMKPASLAYVTGADLTNAVDACHRFAEQGLFGTIGYWDSGQEDPQVVANHYLSIIAALEKQDLNCYLSIKAPPLGLSETLITEVVDRARDTSIGIHFDSLAPEAADKTFSLIASAVQRYSCIGCTLPGRWRRSTADANLAVDLGINVRVVKGQWGDPEQPKLNKREIREGYLSVIDQLARKAKHVAVATHDPILAREALHRLQESGTSCELELLFGLPMNAVMQVAKEVDVNIRIYIPYGKAYMPYALTQVYKKPQILWWYMRDSFKAVPKKSTLPSMS